MAALALAPAHAARTAAGVRIESAATASYAEGSGTRTIASNAASVVVDELLDVAVASLDSGAIATASGSAILSFSVTNTGNGSEAFDLQATPASGAANASATIRLVGLDSNGNGLFDPGVDTPLGTPARTDPLAPDTSVRVFVEVSLPADADDASAARVDFSARASTGSGTPGASFAGRGDNGTIAVVGSGSAIALGQGAVVASLATVALAKSAAVADPFGGAQPVSGAQITYSILARVAGTGAVADLVVSDPIPAGTTYQPASLRLDGQPLSDAADGDAGAVTAGAVAVNLGTASSGAAHTITFAVRID